MKKKLVKTLASLSLLIASVPLTSCSADPLINRSYTVSFVTNAEGLTIDPITVKEGYSIEAPEGVSLELTYPDSSTPAIFRGWYTEETFENKWDIENYRVSEDMTLYALWSFPKAYPSEITTADKALSASLTWLQDTTDLTNITVYVSKGSNLVYDERAEEWVQGDTYTYDDSNKTQVEGTFSRDDYQITFDITTALPGGYYKVYIDTPNQEEQTQTDIVFKGNGTEEDPYLIYSANDLRYLTSHDYDSDTYAELKRDIVLPSIYSEKEGAVYDGHFNGHLFTVTLKNNSGLFFTLGANAEVYDVKLTGALSGSDPSIGALANYNYGYIHDVNSSSVAIYSQGGKINDLKTLAEGGGGGIVGTNYASGRITSCTVTSGQANLVQAHIGAGGVAGINYGKIYNMTCSAIVGAYNGNESYRTVLNSYAGIVCGVNYGTIEQVNADGKINVRRIDNAAAGEGASAIGGIAGYNAKGATISECLYQGMRCVGDTYVGGIAGYNDGTIQYCFTGRRVRRPSNTTDPSRMFISPVIGSYYVGGIAGYCGENSRITNVFSTANVYCYHDMGYSVATKASNSIGVMHNQNPRTTATWLGQKYGAVPTNDLADVEEGENNLFLDNSDRIGSVEHNLLGCDYIDGANVPNNELIVKYLTILGDKFGYNSTFGISLLWQSTSTKPISYYE